MEGFRIAYDNRMKLDVLENLACTIPRNPDFYFFLPDANTAGFFAICIEKNELLHACIVCNVYYYQCLHKVLSNGR